MTASRPLAYAREGVQLNREFPNAYQGKFFKEQGISVRDHRTRADARCGAVYIGTLS